MFHRISLISPQSLKKALALSSSMSYDRLPTKQSEMLSGLAAPPPAGVAGAAASAAGSSLASSTASAAPASASSPPSSEAAAFFSSALTFLAISFSVGSRSSFFFRILVAFAVKSVPYDAARSTGTEANGRQFFVQLVKETRGKSSARRAQKRAACCVGCAQIN